MFPISEDWALVCSNVKQLEGGVLDYFKETGGKYWNGDCFVFDERVALDTDLNETEYIYCYISVSYTHLTLPTKRIV